MYTRVCVCVCVCVCVRERDSVCGEQACTMSTKRNSCKVGVNKKI